MFKHATGVLAAISMAIAAAAQPTFYVSAEGGGLWKADAATQSLELVGIDPDAGSVTGLYLQDDGNLLSVNRLYRFAPDSNDPRNLAVVASIDTTTGLHTYINAFGDDPTVQSQFDMLFPSSLDRLPNGNMVTFLRSYEELLVESLIEFDPLTGQTIRSVSLGRNAGWTLPVVRDDGMVLAISTLTNISGARFSVVDPASGNIVQESILQESYFGSQLIGVTRDADDFYLLNQVGELLSLDPFSFETQLLMSFESVKSEEGITNFAGLATVPAPASATIILGGGWMLTRRRRACAE